MLLRNHKKENDQLKYTIIQTHQNQLLPPVLILTISLSLRYNMGGEWACGGES